MDIGYVYKIFHIPICAQKYLDKYLTGSELEIIAHMGTNSFFPLQLAENMHLEVEQAEKLINSAYSRAVLNKDEKNPLAYGIGDFYTRLGVFCQFENEKWHEIPEAARQEISEWYLEEFIRLNRPLWEKGERNDKVVPLEDALEALDAQDGPFYVCLCDCRSILLQKYYDVNEFFNILQLCTQSAAKGGGGRAVGPAEAGGEIEFVLIAAAAGDFGHGEGAFRQ